MNKVLTLGLVVVATGHAEAQVPAEPACIYADQTYSIPFTGCFLRVRLTCTDHNVWQTHGTCGDTQVPNGSTAPGLPTSFVGQLCNAGGYYSPGAEGCIGGVYQVCKEDGQWDSTVNTADAQCQ